MTKPQIIEQDGKPAFVVLPISEWERIEELIQDIDDQAAIDLFRANREETFPSAVADALLIGQNPVRVYRQHRAIKQKALADAAGITVPYLSQIEKGVREPSIDVAKKLAGALGVMVDDIV